MDQAKTLGEKISGWLGHFAQALDNWESWLYQIEKAYLSGNYRELAELENAGDMIQADLAEAHQAREELLRMAAASGFPALTIASLVRQLDPHVPLPSQVRLRQLTQQLRRAHQMSAALWVTGYQASGYMSALLEILSTGNPDRATYAPNEREALEGGRIVDAAA